MATNTIIITGFPKTFECCPKLRYYFKVQGINGVIHHKLCTSIEGIDTILCFCHTCYKDLYMQNYPSYYNYITNPNNYTKNDYVSEALKLV